MKAIINLATSPLNVPGWRVEYHLPGPKEWEFNLRDIVLHRSPNQINGRKIIGHQLRQELSGHLVFNANLAHYLVAHSDLIPSKWSGSSVFFWGTIYKKNFYHSSQGVVYILVDGLWRSVGDVADHRADVNLFVACLHCDKSDWFFGLRALWLPWAEKDPAAVERPVLGF